MAAARSGPVVLCALLAALAGSPAVAITRGEPVSDAAFRRDFPWVVAIENESGKGGVCTGALITRRVVVTAAHCTGPGRIVRVGSASRSDGRRIAVREFVRHPQYRPPPDIAYDIGILKLVRPVRVEPLAIPTIVDVLALLHSGADATIAGWGHTGPGSPQPDRLHARTVMLQALQIRPTEIAFWTEGGPCGGDSGGPLVMRAADGVPLLMGVASRTAGNLCGRGGGFSGYTHVQALLGFLREQVPDLPERLPPVDIADAA